MFTFDHLHPMVVHFPIAFILAGFLAELGYLFFTKNQMFLTAANWLLYIGAVGAIASYASGAFLTESMYGAAGVTQSSHELFAEITVVLALLCSVLKIYLQAEGKENSRLKWIASSLYALTVVSVCITGYYGGLLVYGYLIK